MRVSGPFEVQLIPRLLAATPIALGAEVSSYQSETARWHPAAGEWCANEVVGHLIEAERRGFAGRILTMLRELDPPLQAWDPDHVARQRHDCDRESSGLLDEFKHLRTNSVRMVENLRSVDLERTGVHPIVGTLTIGELLHEWIHHDRNHLKQVMTNLQRRAWPSMGNAQRFSLPLEP